MPEHESQSRLSGKACVAARFRNRIRIIPKLGYRGSAHSKLGMGRMKACLLCVWPIRSQWKSLGSERRRFIAARLNAPDWMDGKSMLFHCPAAACPRPTEVTPKTNPAAARALLSAPARAAICGSSRDGPTEARPVRAGRARSPAACTAGIRAARPNGSRRCSTAHRQALPAQGGTPNRPRPSPRSRRR